MKPAPQRRQPAGAGTATLAFGAVISLGAVGVALWTQHARDMQPCAWCVRAYGLGVAAFEVGSAYLRHEPLERLARPVTLADRIVSGLELDAWLPEIFQPRASCADAAVRLWGLSYEFWSLGLFMLLSALALRRLLRKSG